MIKLIIFDFDDTLIDNQILDYNSFKILSLRNNLRYPTKKELIHFRKNNYLATQIISWISLKSNLEFNQNLYIKKRKQFLQSKNSIDYLKLRPNVKKFFKFLKFYGIKIIICTMRTNKKIIEIFLEKNKLLDYVDDIVYRRKNPKNLAKKNPENIKNILIKNILKKFPFKKSEFLSIGDSVADEEAAKQNNISYFIMRFDNDHISRPKLKNQIDSYKEIINFLNRINNYG